MEVQSIIKNAEIANHFSGKATAVPKGTERVQRGFREQRVFREGSERIERIQGRGNTNNARGAP